MNNYYFAFVIQYVYINDLSRSLSELPIGCCSGENVINHLMYADDIVLLSASAKGMQSLRNKAYAYQPFQRDMSTHFFVRKYVFPIFSRKIILFTIHLLWRLLI